MSTRVAIMGVEGTFGHEALLAFSKDLNLDLETITTSSFESLRNLVETDEEISYFFVPARNNTSESGSVPEGLNIVMDHGQVLGEQQLRIRHCLVKVPGMDVGENPEVHTHKQAMSQCERFLLSKGLNNRRDDAGSTAGAGLDLIKGIRKGYAICSEVAAGMYGLEIVEKDIHDYPRNTTRFLFARRKNMEDTLQFKQREVTDYKLAILSKKSTHALAFFNYDMARMGFVNTQNLSTPKDKNNKSRAVFSSKKYLEFSFGLNNGNIVYTTDWGRFDTGIPFIEAVESIKESKKTEILGIFEMHKTNNETPWRQDENSMGSLSIEGEFSEGVYSEFNRQIFRDERRHGVAVYFGTGKRGPVSTRGD